MPDTRRAFSLQRERERVVGGKALAFVVEGMEREMAQEHVVLEKTMCPSILTIRAEKQLDREDLWKMGCERLLDLPWEVPSEQMLAELYSRVIPDGVKPDTLRAQPKMSMAEALQDTYDFPDCTNGYDRPWRDMGLKPRFSKVPLEKNRFRVNTCRIPRKRRLLKFLVPILCPDKPHTVTMQTLRSTNGAYRKRGCGWHYLLQDDVQKEFWKLGARQGCSVLLE